MSNVLPQHDYENRGKIIPGETLKKTVAAENAKGVTLIKKKNIAAQIAEKWSGMVERATFLDRGTLIAYAWKVKLKNGKFWQGHEILAGWYN